MDLTVIATSGVVSAAVAGMFKLWSDIDASRRAFLSGVLVEAYKREAEAYEDLWKEMFALQEAAHNFLTVHAMSVDPTGPMRTKKDVDANATTLLTAQIALTKAMDKNRPFFHDDVYRALKSYTQYTETEQWIAIIYPALRDIKGYLAGTRPKEFDLQAAVAEMMEQIEEVSKKIRKRMTKPQEAFVGYWISFRRKEV